MKQSLFSQGRTEGNYVLLVMHDNMDKDLSVKYQMISEIISSLIRKLTLSIKILKKSQFYHRKIEKPKWWNSSMKHYFKITAFATFEGMERAKNFPAQNK